MSAVPGILVVLLALLGLALGSVLFAPPALAHPAPFGVPGFFGGLLHPAFVPAHLMAALGLGILVGQQAPHWGRAAPATFIVALIVGLAVLTTGVVPRFAGEAVLLLALTSGALVALARPLPERAGCALAAVTGIAIGLDSPPEVVSVRQAHLMLIGTAFGGGLLLIVIVEIATRLTSPWQRTAARILGSWIAASAVLVLAFIVSR
jgi:hydrogenase/urease accessory protein HupE